MGLIRRVWTPKEAEEWTKEDTIAVIISPLVYILLTLGTVLSLLLIPIGFLALFIGILLMCVMVYVIDPKLSTVSREFETKQKDYLEELERKVKWEEL
jgi:hypothetical protein